jgi:hypothetical protein
MFRKVSADSKNMHTVGGKRHLRVSGKCFEVFAKYLVLVMCAAIEAADNAVLGSLTNGAASASI